MPYKLAVLIPARNEMWLARTVQDILEHKSSETEIIIGLDGQWADPAIADHPDVTILHSGVSVGQRGITKQCARLTKAKFIMKLDAHCSVSQDFDIKMLKTFEDLGDNITACPIMKNLHVFDWVCPDGHRRYQGPSGVCTTCGKETKKDIVWIAKNNPQSDSYCFNSEPKFQYFKEWRKSPIYQEQIKTGYTDTMSLQGSCWMMTKDKYFDLDMDDEAMGSWGSQGLTIACKTWLSGGRVIINHNSWYSHCFRTQGGDFGFPYSLHEAKVQDAKAYARELFFNNKYDKAIHNLRWLVEKFNPVPGWNEKELNKLK